MPSIIKVDQIQSDTGTVNIASRLSGTPNVVQTMVVSGSFDGTFDPSLQVKNNTYGGSARFRMGDGGVIGISNSNINSGNDIVRLTTSNVLDLPYGQIKFPASQNASSDPNTLDDYEEGSWTPVFGGGSPVLANNSSAGRYIKIGAMVWVHCQLHFQCTTAGSGGFSITGLPFVSTNVNGHGQALALGALYNWNIDNSAFQIGARVNDGSATIAFWNNFDNNPDAGLNWPFSGGGTQVFGTITGCYRTD